MSHERPAHCKGCGYFHNAGRKDPPKSLEKYNAWCCSKGSAAQNSIGWCKLHGKKEQAK